MNTIKNYSFIYYEEVDSFKFLYPPSRNVTGIYVLRSKNFRQNILQILFGKIPIELYQHSSMK